jgi:hypothetical protein
VFDDQFPTYGLPDLLGDFDGKAGREDSNRQMIRRMFIKLVMIMGTEQ